MSGFVESIITSFWFWLVVLLVGLSFITRVLWTKISERSADNDSVRAPWFLALLIIAITFCIIFFPSRLLTNVKSYNYLLSSINQGLASLFALVFALMFTLTQLSIHNKAESKKVSRIFSKYVLIYIVSFVLAILTPLFIMGTDQILAIKIVLFYASCNVAMLIPFF